MSLTAELNKAYPLDFIAFPPAPKTGVSWRWRANSVRVSVDFAKGVTAVVAKTLGSDESGVDYLFENVPSAPVSASWLSRLHNVRAVEDPTFVMPWNEATPSANAGE